MVPEEGLRKAAAGQCQTHGREVLDTFRRRQNRMRMRQGARLDGTKSPTLVLEKVYIVTRESDSSNAVLERQYPTFSGVKFLSMARSSGGTVPSCQRRLRVVKAPSSIR